MKKTTHSFPSLRPVSIELEFNDLATRFSTSTQSEKLLEAAQPVFKEARNIWQPRSVVKWLPVIAVTDSETVLASLKSASTLRLHTGFSGSFLHSAEMVLAGVYTSGNELDEAVKSAAAQKRYLDGYILEQIGLIVLEKTATVIHEIVEQEAADRNWGVGPLLSPGSVHGWDLTDQLNLCSHLPIDEIDVACSGNGVLTPFNSLSFIIGIGPGYSDTKVGSPCKVCSNRENCTLRKENNVS